MEDATWIKLYRKILKSPIWENEKALKVWIWCLIKATYVQKIQLVGQQKVLLEKGQFVFGRNKASQELQMSESTVYRYINLLKELKMINIKSNNKFSIITIEKWEDYQIEKEYLNSNTNNKRTTNEQQTDTNNNINNIYLSLYNKYKKQIEEEKESKKIRIISECQNCEEYALLTLEEQNQLFLDLMNIDKKFK